jgi:1-acyl-sn-glycerol-3-phosphate acyltransferase
LKGAAALPELIEYRWSPSQQLYRMTRSTLGPVVKRFFRADWYGVEHVPADGAVVLACNHVSNLDPVMLGAACPRQINYLAKIELFGVPVLGSLIRRYGAIPLRRSASDPEAIRLAERVLEMEHVLALFPEGTRSRDGRLKPFRFGAARLALKYNAALIPAAIVGTDRAMPKGAWFPRRVGVKVAFGSAIDISAYQYHRTRIPPEARTLETVTRLLQAEVQRLKTMLDENDHSTDATFVGSGSSHQP